MSDTPEVFRNDGFGRKLGPLPIWGWALALIAIAFVYVRFIHGGAASSSASGAASAVPNVMTTGGYLPADSGSATSSTAQVPGSQFTDNTAWENYAVQSASQFGSSPLSLQSALDTYLKGGGNLSVSQGSIVDRVLSAIGAPPTGTLGSTSVGDTAPAASAPAGAVAGGLFAPTYNGNYVQDQKTGLIAEIESDGSLLGLTPTEWATAASKNGGKIDKINHIGNAYSVSSNLGRVNK